MPSSGDRGLWQWLGGKKDIERGEGEVLNRCSVVVAHGYDAEGQVGYEYEVASVSGVAAAVGYGPVAAVFAEEPTDANLRELLV